MQQIATNSAVHFKFSCLENGPLPRTSSIESFIGSMENGVAKATTIRMPKGRCKSLQGFCHRWLGKVQLRCFVFQKSYQNSIKLAGSQNCRMDIPQDQLLQRLQIRKLLLVYKGVRRLACLTITLYSCYTCFYQIAHCKLPEC